jgi:replicative DNA helicase
MNSDPAAERAVLAALYRGGHESWVEISDVLSPDCFSCGNNSIYYRVLEKMLADPGSKADVPSFLSTASILGFPDLMKNQEEQKYLRALTVTAVDPSNLRKQAARLVKLKKASEFAEVLGKAADELRKVTGEETLGEILGMGEEAVFNFVGTLGNQNDALSHIGKDLDEYLDYLANNPSDMMGVSSGLDTYDQAIGGGFQRGTVNVIGARPKVGKTQLADNIALHVAGKLGIPVLNLDTEMSAKEHWHRMIANLSNVTVDRIKSGKFAADPEESRRVYEAKEAIKKMPYHYASIAGQPFEETVGIMRRWLYRQVEFDQSGQSNPCLVVFDYVKLMDDRSITKNVSEFQALGFLMTNLHNFAVKYQIPVLAFVQLNRDGINAEDTSTASGSDRIIWLCSNFSIYKWKSQEEMAEEGSGPDGVRYNLKLIPVVTRHGKGVDSGDYINVQGQYEFGRIREGPTRNGFLRTRSGRPPVDSGGADKAPQF